VTAVEAFDAVDVIRTKRDGGAVPEDALRWMVDAYTRGYVADSQMAAFAMAVLLNGMERSEIRVMTDAMIASGERMSFQGLGKPTVDKHSTGGVGDKITLPLAPLVASFGVAVPQLSGRGLGHTGGTLDKLESIPGWRAALSNEEMVAQLRDVGAVICAAGSTSRRACRAATAASARRSPRWARSRSRTAHRDASSSSRGPNASGRTSSIVRMPETVSSSMPWRRARVPCSQFCASISGITCPAALTMTATSPPAKFGATMVTSPSRKPRSWNTVPGTFRTDMDSLSP